MSFKTILVHVDESQRSSERVKIAAQLAEINASHVVGLAVTGVSRFIFEGSNINANDPNFTIHLALVRERAERAIAQFEETARHHLIASFEKQVASDEATGGLGLCARHSDLTIIGQTNRNEPSPSVLSDFPEYMVMHAGKPVLVIPFDGEFSGTFQHPLVAWDGSREASRAVSDALPILKNAQCAHVVMINPHNDFDSQSDNEGLEITQFLNRHGVNSKIIIHQTNESIGDALIHVASELQSDLLIMGAYGHSRLREMLMGGVSKTMFSKMRIPTLMSH